MRGPIRATARRGATLQCLPQPKHRRPLPLHTPAQPLIGNIQLKADHRHRPVVGEVRGLRLTAPTPHHLTADSGGGVGGRGCHRPMKPSPTDNDLAPHRWPKLVPLTGLTVGQSPHYLRSDPLATAAGAGSPLASGTAGQDGERADPPAHQSHHPRPGPIDTSQFAVDRVLDHLVPVLARSVTPGPSRAVDQRRHPHPRTRPIDHRHHQELPPQRQHPNHHLRSPAPRSRHRSVLTR
jgi:hypothetical protein